MCTWMILQLSVYAMQCRRIKVHLIIFDAFEFQFTHETYQLNNHSFIHLSLYLSHPHEKANTYLFKWTENEHFADADLMSAQKNI